MQRTFSVTHYQCKYSTCLRRNLYMHLLNLQNEERQRCAYLSHKSAVLEKAAHGVDIMWDEIIATVLKQDVK